ncbi:hypothetical protein Tco_1336534 [Tanacetum coccineum]
MYVTSLKSSKNYKAKPYQYASPSKQIMKAKAKPFPPCSHRGFNDHRPNDFRNYTKCEICRGYDHFTSGNHVILVRGGVLARGEKIQATKARDPSKKWFTRETNQVYYLCRDTSRSPFVIMEYLVKISKKARILELKRRHLKITVLNPIRHIHQGRYGVSMPALHKRP